jgi:hypothetical protein
MSDSPREAPGFADGSFVVPECVTPSFVGGAQKNL